MCKLGLKFDSQVLGNFESWFKDITKETEESVEISVSIKGEATLKPETPFIAKLIALAIIIEFGDCYSQASTYGQLGRLAEQKKTGRGDGSFAASVGDIC